MICQPQDDKSPKPISIYRNGNMSAFLNQEPEAKESANDQNDITNISKEKALSILEKEAIVMDKKIFRQDEATDQFSDALSFNMKSRTADDSSNLSLYDLVADYQVNGNR